MKTYSCWPFQTGRGNRLDTEKLRVDLRLRLMESILWCVGRADPDGPAACLRTPELRPYLFNDSRHDSVYDVVYARHQALVEAKEIERFEVASSFEEMTDIRRLIPPSLGGGRLLVWVRDETIDDGVGEHVTGGYLDYSDMPPWDTWVVYVSREDDPAAHAGYLVSWVPPQFVPCVGRAIEENAYNASYWLRGTDLLVARVLEEDGLLA